MRVLVSAASRHDSTAGIGRRIAETLRCEGMEAILVPPDLVGRMDGFDAVVLGSGVYYGHWLPQARRLAVRFRSELRTRPVWLFSSGPVNTSGRALDQIPVRTDEQIDQLAALEHRVFGGRLSRRELSLRERIAVTVARIPDSDERDWMEIDAWALQIAAYLEQHPTHAAPAVSH